MIISGIWELNKPTDTWRLADDGIEVYAPGLTEEQRGVVENITHMDLCDDGIKKFFDHIICDAERVYFNISSEPPPDGVLWYFVKQRYHGGTFEWVIDAGNSDQSPWPFSIDRALTHHGQERYYLWCEVPATGALSQPDPEDQRVDPPVQARVVIESVQLTISAREARRIYDRLHAECPVELLPLYNAVASLREVLADQED